MATEIIQNKSENTKIENSTPVSSGPLDIQKFTEEAGRKKRGPYKKKDKEKLRAEGWGIKPKAGDESESEKEIDPDKEKELIAVCYSQGIQESIQALYKKGLMAVIFLDFKFSKIDTKLLPKNPVEDQDAKVWALSLTDYLIEHNGAGRTLKILRPIVLIGQPIIIVSKEHFVGKLNQVEKQIDKMIQEKENAK